MQIGLALPEGQGCGLPGAAVEHHQHSLEARLPFELRELLLAELLDRVVDPFGRQAGEPAQPDVHGTLLIAQTPAETGYAANAARSATLPRVRPTAGGGDWA
jgi:hypothetical protein